MPHDSEIGAHHLQMSEKTQSRELIETKPKKIVFVYRDNNLFSTCVSAIKKILVEQGIEFDVHVFPSGTPNEEVKKWCNEHSREMSSSKIVVDETVLASLGDNHGSITNLDSLMRFGITEALLGDSVSYGDRRTQSSKGEKQKNEYLLMLEELYVNILTMIPVEKRKQLTFIILTGTLKGFPTLLEHEIFVSRDNSEKYMAETNLFAEKMKQWFIKAEISQVVIYSTGSDLSARDLYKLTSGKAYAIFDRHTFVKTEDRLSQATMDLMERFWGGNTMYSGLIKEAYALEAPVETFVADLVSKAGLVEINNTSVIEEAARRIVALFERK